MPKIIVVAAALAFGVSAAMAQTMSAADYALKDSLSMDQQRQIGEIITNDPTAPLTHINFSLSVDGERDRLAQVGLDRLSEGG